MSVDICYNYRYMIINNIDTLLLTKVHTFSDFLSFNLIMAFF